MSIFDAFAPALARTLIDTADLAGRAATIRRPGPGKDYDPATGTVSGGNPDEDYPCKVVLEDFNQQTMAAGMAADGTLIQRGDRLAMVARQTIGIEPEPNSDVLIMGPDPDAMDVETWEIVRVIPTSSGEQDAMYTLHIRK